MFYYEPYIIVIIIAAILLILEYPLLKTFLIDEDSSKLKPKRAIPKKKTVKRAPKQKIPKRKTPKTPKQKKIKKSKITQAPTPTTSAAATIIANQEDIRKLELQIKSINTMIQNIDIKFRNGEISQAKYYEKKSFLAEKLGGLNGQLEQLKG